ncbi:FAD-dependent oxidoreductase [Nocardioides sp. HDW12B]|uniref:FAD-dependent oxidoreductase n=1 Tax=Nocardioides sp. HDW12B TaxID=2714939 RepID=UPI0014090AF8|nr:FAD-dependent oxidoreductase [Nocardioides sp. HDW12B]QIK68228.1 FAD-dependent oxidoreductase [Nocardioides sp. HDW12B]
MTTSRSCHVVVVGSGISGLTCAEALLRAGHDVTVVSADALARTTSHLAAAVWFPTAAGPPDAVARWGRTTFDLLAAHAATGVPGVTMRESLVLFRPGVEVPDELPAWAASVGDVRPARADELPPGYPAGWRFAVPLVEMPVHLPWLHAQVVAAGAREVVRRLRGLDDVLDLRPDVVVNAAGMAAGALVGDDSVYPVRGQIVRVRNPGVELSVRDEHHPGGRAYVHPRTDDCILGGTLERGSWSTEPDPAETAAILERCADIVPALAGAEVLESVAGLRPGRSEVRIERDDTLLPVPVVHDYGHGGAGITVGWGCAQDVVALVGSVEG